MFIRAKEQFKSDLMSLTPVANRLDVMCTFSELCFGEGAVAVCFVESTVVIDGGVVK